MYEKLVKELKKIVPELEEIDVHFNDHIATKKGPYSKVLSNRDLIELGRFISTQTQDLLIVDERKGIFLPTIPITSALQKCNPVVVGIFKDRIMYEIGFCNSLTLEVFTILHELGHILDCKNSGDAYRWLEEASRQIDFFKMKCSMGFLETLEQQTVAYRNIPQEKIADSFAMSKLKVIFGRG